MEVVWTQKAEQDYYSLFYRFVAEAEQIILLRFWPNRQDPKELDL